MLAGGQRCQSDRVMRGIRRADMDDVDVGVGDCLVGFRIGALHSQISETSRRLLGALRVRRRYALQCRAGKPACPGMNRAHHPCADDCHTECLSHFFKLHWVDWTLPRPGLARYFVLFNSISDINTLPIVPTITLVACRRIK